MTSSEMIVNGEIRVDRNESVVTLTLSNPGRRNAITYEMYDRLESELRVVGDDRSVRVLVLRGAEGSFAGGTDIRHFTELTTGEQGIAYEGYMRRVQSALVDLRVPVIAAVQGVCVGGGLVLAALSDLVYAGSDARFGSPIARTLGNTLSPTSLARLYECFGRRRTSEMLLTGRLVNAEAALAAGFVNAVVDPEELDAVVEKAIAAILECAPLTIRSFKEFERRIDAAMSAVETADVYDRIYGSSDFREGVAAFLEHRRPTFTGE